MKLMHKFGVFVWTVYLLKHGVIAGASLTILEEFNIFLPKDEFNDEVGMNVNNISATPTTRTYNMYPDWMSRLSNSLSIGQLSIPGTHDSMSFYGGDLSETQRERLPFQFDYGIRALDIRCRHIENVCVIHHGPVFQNAFLGDVLDMTVTFLANNPTEVILMRLKEEHTPSGNTRTLPETIEWYVTQYAPYIWTGGDRVPTLGEVRGKIVILDQIAYGRFGINWFKCGTCDSPCTTECIQDQYVVPTILPGDINAKWDHVNNHLTRTNAGSATNLYINFLSGASSGAYPNAVADRINIRFIEHMRGNTLNYQKIGAIMMDFFVAEQISQIIDVNFHSVSVHANFFEHQYEEGESKIFTIQPNYCINFGYWNDRASSLETRGYCVRLWEHSDCTGAHRDVQGSSDSCAYSLARCGWNDITTSISHCY